MEEQKPPQASQSKATTENAPATEEKHISVADALISIRDYIANLVDFRHGTDEKGTVEGIKRDIDFTGHNIWILVCSIFIASIGLNTNSTAVVIGAMLISPLMGPILGVGLSIGINDFQTLVRSLRNLGIAVGISVLTSTIYFAISPITEAQSELLARTQPTIFDVFIALFGGFAGIIAGSRKEKSNVTPGVAIATALMPPLCTAGFGIATGSWSYFLGAFYLFFINSVLICVSTFLVVRFLHFHKKAFVNPERERRVRYYILIFVIITIIPSILLAVNVVRNSIFKAKVNSFLNEEVRKMEQVKLINFDAEKGGDTSFVELTLYGSKILSEEEIADLERIMQREYDLENIPLVVNQSRDILAEVETRFDAIQQNNGMLDLSIVEDLYKQSERLVADKDSEIKRLRAELSTYKRQELARVDPMQIRKEVQINYKEIEDLYYSEATIPIETTDTSYTERVPFALVRWKSNTSKRTRARLEGQLVEWLEVRLRLDTLRIAEF